MAEKTINIAHLSCRNDTSENWTLKNPVLKKGEWGLETDTFSMKFGDGVSEWNSLVYAGKKGDTGKSAYQVWLEQGNSGSEQDFLVSLKGVSGVYVGSGDMPEGYNVQIDITGEPLELLTKEEVQAMIAEQNYETWTFTLEDGSTIEKKVLVK